ncbi:RICIN domain-containing protein [Kitasatospora sp. NPDC058965]|uniref:RICIN domain-containing protein n=1 Tax=Kitasatospora sp. NPDC058965 TaxID=3346682 RepID=UPI0036C6F27D
MPTLPIRLGRALRLTAAALTALALGAAPTVTARAATPSTFTPAAAWTDQNGNQLQLHGLGIVKAGSTWYGFGEDHTGETASDTSFKDIPCYSSTDLQHWTYQSQALGLQSTGDLGPHRIVERPKVLYNATTGTYVMYLHIDSPSYAEAKVGVATSSTPCGPYTYRGSFQPLGFQSRDLGLYQDSDGSAYLLSEDRANGLRIDRLSADYLSVTSSVALLGDYEAPALVKANGRYYLFGSHLSGWGTNDNVYATATSLAGPWSAFTTFAPAGTQTYNSQTANVIPVTGTAGTSYVFAADRWNTGDLGNSPLVWLPLTLSGTTANVGWFNSWSLDTAAGTWTANSSLPPTGSRVLTSANSSLLMDDSGASTADASPVIQWPANGGTNQRWTLQQVSGNTYTVVNALSGKCLDTTGHATAAGTPLVQSTCTPGAPTQQWLADAVGSYTDPANAGFTLVNLAAGLVVDVPNNSTSQGTQLALWSSNGGKNQTWQLS